MGGTYRVAVVGATGAVGRQMLACLEERRFPVARLTPLASERSLGKEVTFLGKEIPVEVLGQDSFDGVEIALFSAGGGISKEYAPIAAAAGAVVVDNSSAWRMDPEVPLVVPEVNPRDIGLYTNRGIIANPNCSTIQMVVVLKPLHDAARLRRVVVSTYQAVSGTGQKAVEELLDQVRALLSCQDPVAKVYPHRIAFNVLPHIDAFQENGYTKEEMKLVYETRKILEDDRILISPTTVRVPVFTAHSVSVHVETEAKITPAKARELCAAFPGLQVQDDPANKQYPMPLFAAGKDDCYVGRIREDLAVENGLNLWVCGDQLRKGAALNAVQIAERLIEKHL